MIGQIVDSSIVLSDPAVRSVDATKDYSITAFVDTVDTDVDATYPFTKGVCGVKTFSLVSPPAFLSVTLGSD